jgi:DNA-binding transcriptional LysR family regulator
VLLCGLGDQARMLRDGRADVALMQRPFDAIAGFDTEDLRTEQQIAILPAGHPLAARPSLTMADVGDLPDLPLARWPRPDGTYDPGPGPEIHDQSQLAQLIALGHTAGVLCASSRQWLWNAHAAIPLTDAPHVTTVLAWPSHSRSLAVAGLVRTAARL